MDLVWAPNSFQMLMETIIHGLCNLIVYIDNLLLHSSTHNEHTKQSDMFLQ